MSSAASSASPAIARSSSHASRRYVPPSADLPHRAQSTTTRPSSSSTGHRATSSRSHSYDRPPPSNQAALTNAARRDYENPNLARPSSSRRSSSREGQHQESSQSYRSESTRTSHRSGSRHGHSHGHSRHSNDMSGAATVVANGGSTPVPSSTVTAPSERSAPSSGQPRRRTTITAQTGSWALGKTIGAGSMGKVKLAKNLETGEQVCQ
jgi:serine/threonine protein kinase KIN1/2